MPHLVVAQVQVCHRVVVHQTACNHAYFVVLQQIAWQGKGDQGLGLLQGLGERSAIWKLHAKHGTIIAHACVPQPICEAEMRNAAAGTETSQAGMRPNTLE